ncbi:MoxR family ATPase [Lujinxingia vulgaris]|uniref:MoxR family ATPase n=1 Tax=Lujinxingia vulgaris TaxID=2600176 RepID=A0A5C6XGG2_9DELT|nr:MoxR family ATPase [Lujinxingia vulgaris]TXD36276.1 MoxR family ATPase [Lujinxingia vulgaris]
MSDAPANTAAPASSAPQATSPAEGATLPQVQTPDGAAASIAEERLKEVRAICDAMRAQVSATFIGPPEVVDALLVALFARGHILLEGVPGVAKTTLCRAFARTIDATFRRVQFTPDLLPSDITGTYVPNLSTNAFELRRGPVFTNVLLGDEINRAPAKTQSAMLEAMQERQVTIEGVTHTLPSPFVVLATQNPIEQEGVYMLPEAQLDRFLLKLTIGYPTPDQELEVLKTHRQSRAPVEAVISAEQAEAIIGLVEQVHISHELMRYILGIVRQTRTDTRALLGASPRASLALLKAAQARALIRGRGYVLPDDIQAMAVAVLAHRIVLHPDAELDGTRGQDLVESALKAVRYG